MTLAFCEIIKSRFTLFLKRDERAIEVSQVEVEVEAQYTTLNTVKALFSIS